MGMMKHEIVKDYSDGRTKQAFKNETDIQRIIAKAEKTGTVSHLAKYEGFYGDFAEFDFHEAQNTIARAGAIFSELPGEVRREFSNSPAEFFAYANDVKNVDRLATLLPGLAAPGRQLPAVRAPVADEVAKEEPEVVREPPVAAEKPEEA